MANKIPITVPWFGPEEKKLLAETIDSGWVAQGPRVAQFEQIVAEFIGARHAVAVSSGTTAIHLALAANNIGPGDETICRGETMFSPSRATANGISPGDEVIVPSFTFIATANAVRHAGATPVFVDIDPETYNIDPEKIEAAITPATRAVMCVHQLGLPADMDRINDIARKHSLLVVEDGACALGSRHNGKRLGAESRMFTISFHPRKLITTGEGGMIITNDDELAHKFRLLRHHGMSVSDVERHNADRIIFEAYDTVGYNYRMSDLQAAVGIAQMARINEILALRETLAQNYNNAFTGSKHLGTPIVPPYATHNRQSYILRIRDTAPISRDELMMNLLEKGIATRRGVMACHVEKAHKDLPARAPLPETERALRETVVIPLYPTMNKDQQTRVIDAILDLVK